MMKLVRNLSAVMFCSLLSMHSLIQLQAYETAPVPADAQMEGEENGASYDDIVELPDGEDDSKIYKVGDYKYIITGSSSVSIIGWNDRNAPADGKPNHQQVSPIKGNFTIPASVSIQNKTYNVTHVGAQLLYCNTAVTDVTIPATVRSMDPDVFAGCSGLQNINVQSGNSVYSSSQGVLYSRDGRTLMAMPAGRTGSFSVPSSVSVIGENAFMESQLRKVQVPDSVTALDTGAFARSSLKEIDLPGTLNKIGPEAFSASAIEQIVLPESVLSMGWNVFANCTALRSVSLPSRLTALPAFAFAGCSALRNISIPAAIKIVPEYAFMDCSALRSVSLPKGLLTIGAGAFQNCASLERIVLPATLTTMGFSAFTNTGLQSVVLPDALSAMQGMTFANCSKLKEVYLPESGRSFTMGYGEFLNDTGLKLYGAPASAPAWLDAEYTGLYVGSFNYDNLPEQDLSGWVSEGGKTYYRLEDGTYATGWMTLSGKTYYFEGDGAMKKGWLHLNDVWYYFLDDGSMARNQWVGKYYLDNNGVWVQPGWSKSGGKWYYRNDQGQYVKNRWIKDNGNWYYMGQDGTMQTGWLEEGGHTYLLRSGGEMAYSRWVQVKDDWYYFVSSGEMAKDRWIQLKGKWYFLQKDGVMASNTVINGWRVGADGAWDGK